MYVYSCTGFHKGFSVRGGKNDWVVLHIIGALPSGGGGWGHASLHP